MDRLGKDNPNETLTPYIDDAETLHWLTLPEFYLRTLGSRAIYKIGENEDGTRTDNE